MEFVHTKHQTPRGAMADAEDGERLFLFKNASELRLTYQIRMLAYAAHTRGKKIVISLSRDANVHDSLNAFVRSFPELIKVERRT